MKPFSSAFFLVLSLLVGYGVNGQSLGTVEIVRQSPTAFEELPKAVSDDLVKRGCSVPESYVTRQLHNVVSGEFQKKGQRDWAVLCSDGKSSSIIIYWAGKLISPSVIAPSLDESWVQDIGGGNFQYSRYITLAQPKRVAALGVKSAKPHAGIEEVFGEKASAVYYYSNGKWQKYRGGD